MTKDLSEPAKASCPFRYTTPLGTGDAYSKPTRDPTWFETIMQMFQIHTICHPKGILARVIQPLINLWEGQVANLPYYLSYQRAAFGENFCAAGQVVLGEWKEVERALTSPQARTFRLGTAPISEARCPKAHGKTSFLLALSQQGAGGDGSWEAYNGAFHTYIIDNGAYARQDDPTAQALMDKLVEDYKTMDHGEGGEFFKSTKGGIWPFLNKYIHYCLWGIDPKDEETVNTLLQFYYGGAPPAAFYLGAFGAIFNRQNKDFAPSMREVEKIYENAPALKNFDSSAVKGITKREMADLSVIIMAIAGTRGPLSLIRIAMGGWPMREYKEGVDTSKIKPTDIWDKLNLDDEKEVQDYLLECGRLDQPVGHVHRVAQEEFTVEMRGKNRTFPKGTIISIPINMSCVNKDLYGDDVFEFDHKRKNLRENSTIFNSVGKNHAGRVCPGRIFAMRMMTEILQKTGKTRR